MASHGRAVDGVALAAGLAMAAGGLVGCGAGSAQGPAGVGAISGRYILSVSDADMAGVAGGAAEVGAGVGVGGASAAALRDTLSVLSLPIATRPGDAGQWRTDYAQAEVGSSVLGASSVVAVSDDGRTAVVAETFGGAGSVGPGLAAVGSGAAWESAALPESRHVTIVDLSDPLRPTPTARVEVGPRPMSVDIRPGGGHAFVATQEPGGELVLIDLRSGGEPLAFPIPGLSVGAAEGAAASPAGPVGGVAWHPSGESVAVCLPGLAWPQSAQGEAGAVAVVGAVDGPGAVALLEFTADGNSGGPGLAQWGAPVAVQGAFEARFAPDGKHLVVLCPGWTGSPAGDGSGEWGAGPASGSPSGAVALVRVDDGGAHTPLSRLAVPAWPKGIALSPDGGLIAVVSLGDGGLADGRTTGGWLTLLRLEAAPGREGTHGLAEVARLSMPAVPAGVAFDTSGRHVVVSQFRSDDPEITDGELVFFRIGPGAQGGPGADADAAVLERLPFRVGVGVGPHGTVIVR